MNSPKRKRTPAQRRSALNFHAHEVAALKSLALRLNSRPDRLRVGKLRLAWRYLSRFHGLRGLLPWHIGSAHVGRPDFGPMIYQARDGNFAVDPRRSA